MRGETRFPILYVINAVGLPYQQLGFLSETHSISLK